MVKTGKFGAAFAMFTQSLRSGEHDLFGRKTLSQQVPVTPLQLHGASLTVDHVLLSPGQKVAVLSADDGKAAHAYATARPHWDVIGWTPDIKDMLRAQALHALPNLQFDKQPHQKRPIDVQAILAIAWAHQIFSSKHYSVPALVAAVRELILELPEHGQLLIQDVALPDDPDKFVLLDIENDEAAAALVTFSQSARPQLSQALRGFFVETIPAPRAGITRFRLQYKWAAEFFQRWRLKVAPDAPFELTTLTTEQWAALAEQCGGRATYRAPHMLDTVEAEKLSKDMQFFDERENPMPLPPASFSVLVEKITQHHPASMYERRPSQDEATTISIKGLENPQTKEKQDLVDIDQKEDDVLVWRIDEDKNLRVWLRTGVPRPIINTVPRGTPNLDGRRWAGYLMEPLTMPALDGPPPQNLVTDTIQKQTGLSFEHVGAIRVGVNYYSAPEYLAQRVRGIFVQVNAPLPPQDPARQGPYIMEVYADDVYRALSCGLIPDSKLEILLNKLMHETGFKPKQLGEMLNRPELKPVLQETVNILEAPPVATLNSKNEIAEYVTKDGTGEIRAIRSLFVEDQVSQQGRQAMTVSEHDFIMPSKLSANTAVCVPLVRNPMGRFFIATEQRRLEVPNRLGDDEPMSTLTSFRLPETVRNFDEARAFLAEAMGVDIEDVTTFGPSFFLHPHLSPERIYPFLIRANRTAYHWERWVKPRGRLNKLTERPVEKTMAYVEGKAMRDLGEWYTGFTPDITNEVTQKATAPFIPEEPPELHQSNDNTLKPQLN